MQELVCSNIRKLRTRRKFSQTRLARELGMSRSKISSWELGRRGLTLEDAIKVAKVFTISIDDLALKEIK